MLKGLIALTNNSALEEEEDPEEIKYIVYRTHKALADIEKAEMQHYEFIHESVAAIVHAINTNEVEDNND
jgi:hypothetical protein